MEFKETKLKKEKFKQTELEFPRFELTRAFSIFKIIYYLTQT